jgi:hypothetical protein
MKEIMLVRLAINPQTGAVDHAAPFVVKEPGVIEQFRPGEREAQFEAERSKQEGGWQFGKRVIDA